MTNWNRLYEEGLPDELPINVLPYANEEFLPAAPTRNELEIRRIALEACDEEARRRGVSRRKFLQTGAAAAITLAAINKVMGTSGGYYALARHNSDDPKACTEEDLHWPGAQMNNLPGEFIMDVQTHHVDVEDDQWRTQNPGQAAFFAAIWSQSACGEEDRLECLGRYHYIKEMFLDSSTNVTALSAVPYKPDGQPLPIERAAETCDVIKEMAGGTNRSVMHRFVMPNRGSAGHRSDSVLGTLGAADPVFLGEELELMEYTASTFNEHIRAWKVYTPWGDVPNTSGWWLDDPAGRKFIEHGLHLSQAYNMPALICTHKGFALPTFDQEKAATRDVGIVARTYPGMHFMVYHSGYDGDGIGLGGPLNQGTSTTGPYPLDIAPDGSFSRGAGSESEVRSIDRGVDNFIKALRENGWSARHFAPGGMTGVPFSRGDGDPMIHANVPNVSGELGTVWSNVHRNPERASYLLGKLIYYVGPRRVIWGTDSLWGGSPQGAIMTFRSFQMSEEIRELYNLPYGLDGDIDDPTRNALDGSSYPVGGTHSRFPDWPADGQPHPERTIRNGILGRNAAAIYRVDPDLQLAAISCDQLSQLRDDYQQTPMNSNDVHGPRTAAGVWEELKRDPWFNGARARQNAAGFMNTLR